MLHCRGGTFYVGQTDDLDRRVAEHESGAIKGFTSERLPVKLVWSEEFPTRLEALEAERKLKGWSKAKKMALIRSDWASIQNLARNHQPVRAEPVEALPFSPCGTSADGKKDGPSTSSGQTEFLS